MKIRKELWFGYILIVMILIPIGLTLTAFFVVRSMARTALRLDDAEAATRAVAAAQAGPTQPTTQQLN